MSFLRAGQGQHDERQVEVSFLETMFKALCESKERKQHGSETYYYYPTQE